MNREQLVRLIEEERELIGWTEEQIESKRHVLYNMSMKHLKNTYDRTKAARIRNEKPELQQEA
jgi:hypothetical protein